MNQIETQDIKIETSTETKPDGTKRRKTKVAIGTEDVVAIGGILVALLIAIGMIAGLLPVNKYTYGLAGLTAAGAVIVKIMGSRKKTK